MYNVTVPGARMQGAKSRLCVPATQVGMFGEASSLVTLARELIAHTHSLKNIKTQITTSKWRTIPVTNHESWHCQEC